MTEELMPALATAVEIACTVITSPGQAALQASVDEACRIPSRPNWERRAAAHAGFFTALAKAAGDPCAAPVLNHGAKLAYDLLMGAGSAADGIVINSRRRMLTHLRAGHPYRAALEMEEHLQILRLMDRLATSAARASA
jgi:DNA-binding GntR family transcriptional regulator